MEMGKLTAKLRDAVPVCLLVEGKEIKRYKNIEIPDDLKKLEYQDYKFDVPAHGAITFKIMFEPGVLPEVFPDARERRSRKTAREGTATLDDAPIGAREADAYVDVISEPTENEAPLHSAEMGEGSQATIAKPNEPATNELAYHVTGERRKELVKAISQFTGMTAMYHNTPTFAFAIGNYTVDNSGTLTGENNAALLEAMAEQGFITK